jgi:hypothetical protein
MLNIWSMKALSEVCAAQGWLGKGVQLVAYP